MKGTPGLTPASSVQSKRRPSPPGRVASLGGRASNSSRSATWAYSRMGERSARSAIGSAFITGRPKRVRTCTHAVGRLLAVQLQHVGLERLDDVAQQVSSLALTVSATLAARPRDPRAQHARGLQAEVARAGREEHEADQVGAGFQRRIERFRGLQAADFDGQRHDGRVLAPYSGARKAKPATSGSRRRDALVKAAPAAPGRPRAGGGPRARRAGRARPHPTCGRCAARRSGRSQAAMPPTMTPRISTMKMTMNSGRWTHRPGWRRDRVEGHRHRLPVGHREDDDDHGQRHDE